MGSLHARGIGFNASLPDVLEFEVPLSLKIAEFRHVYPFVNLYLSFAYSMLTI
jgi:hypothetical protein